MTTQEQYIERLKEMVATKFGREIHSTEDCRALAEAATEATGNNLDHRMLELMFLAKRRSIAPRPVVLSTLACYVGFNSWSDLCSSREVSPAADTDIIPTTRRWGVIILTVAAIILVISATLYLLLGGIFTSDNSPERIAEISLPVEEHWRAIATEQCIDIRAYSAQEDYSDLIEELIATSKEKMDREVGIEIATRTKSLGVSLDKATIDNEAASIIDGCLNIYDCLRIEQTMED